MTPPSKRGIQQSIRGNSFTIFPTLFFSIFFLLNIDYVSCDIIQITKMQITNFSFFKSQQVQIDIKYVGYQLIMEVNFQNKIQGTLSESQFIFIAAEPGTILPDYYNVLFQQKINSYQQNQMHLDLEGYSSLSRFQMIQISSLTIAQTGQWNIGFYDLKSDKITLYNIDITIYVQSKNELYCPNNCNIILTQSKPLMEQNSCNRDQGVTQNYCDCAEEYIGQSCQFYSPLSDVDEDMMIQISPLAWSMRSFNISDHKDDKFYLKLTGPYNKMKMSIVYGPSSDILVPNIIYDFYDIVASSSLEQQEQLPIQDKLNNMFDPDVLNTVNNKYPFRNKAFDQVLIVGFYNQNPTTLTSFNFILRVASTSTEDISGLNQSTMIMFIVFGCVIIFCVTPITYFCVKQKRKQEQDFLNQVLNNNNPENAQQPQNSNPLRQEIVSDNNLNQQADQNNQNGILDQLNQPINQLIIQNNQIINNNGIRNGDVQIDFGQNQYSRQIFANQMNMPQERLKPLKKVVPITKETINRFMPKQKYSDIIRLYPTLKNEGEECTVCLETFDQSTECRITPCYHLFHSDCLESWFQKHSTCPYCRNSCNRKGIIQQLQSRQQNSYIKRMQQPFQKESKKQIKSDGDVEDDNTDRFADNLQNAQTVSPGRRPHQMFNSPEKNDDDKNGQVSNNNYNLNTNDVIKIDNQMNNTNNSAQKMEKKSSIVNTMLEVINKPFQAIKKEIGYPSPNIKKRMSSPIKSKDEPQKPHQLNINQNRMQNESPKNFLSNNSINRNINNINNNQLLSINCLSQNGFMEGGNELFSFISPNLSQQQVQPNDVLLSLNNSIQKRFSVGERNGKLSPENSFQMVSTTRKMFMEQEQTPNRFNNRNSQAIQTGRLSFNNLDKDDDYQVSFRRYGQNSIDQGNKMFFNEADMIDNYGEANIENDEDIYNALNMISYHKNKQSILALSQSSGIKKPIGNIEVVERIKNEIDDPSNLPQSENDQSQRINQIPLPTRNILSSQPRFFQESKRREESFRLNNTHKSDRSSRNKMSFLAENIQNTSVNRTNDDKRYQNNTIKINKNRFQEEVSSQRPQELIQLSSDISSFKTSNKKQLKSFDEKQLENIQIVNKLIVLDDEEEDNEEIAVDTNIAQKQDLSANK